MTKLGSFTKTARERDSLDITMADALELGDQLAAVELTVSQPGLLIDDRAVLTQSVRIWVSGGVAGVDYQITSLITTAFGRRLEDVVTVKVR